MKRSRYLMIVICLALLISCVSACASEENTEFLYYYKASNASGAESPIIGVSSRMTAEAPVAMLAAEYFNGPAELNALSPFPRGTCAINCTQEGDRLAIILSDEILQLSGVELTLAWSCIARTFLQLPSVRTVVLSYGAGSDETKMTFSDSSFLYFDNTPEMVALPHNIYYPDESGRYLVPVPCYTSITNQQELISWCIEMIKNPPANSEYISFLGKAVSLQYSAVENGVCYLDFSKEFWYLSPANEIEERMLLYSIIDTITELEGISAVYFLINGQTIDTFYSYSLSDPFLRNEDCIGSVRTGFGETDASLFLPGSGMKSVLEIPIKLSANTLPDSVEVLIGLLFSYGTNHGVRSLTDGKMPLYSLTVYQNTCSIRLDPEIFDTLQCPENVLIDCVTKTVQSVGAYTNIKVTIQ